MSEADFAVSIVARDGLLMLGVRVSRSIDKKDLNAFVAKVIEAFASVEGVSPEEMDRLLLTLDKNSECEHNFDLVFKRSYSDSEYPSKLERALRGGTILEAHMH